MSLTESESESIRRTTPAPRRRWWKRIAGVLRYLVSLGLLGWILWKNRSSFLQVLGHRPDPGLIVLAFALGLTGLVSTFVRWLVVVRAQGLTLRFRDAIRVGFMSNAIDLVIPGQIGGEVLKANFLARSQGGMTKAVASSLVDRAVGILGLFSLAALMGALSWPQMPEQARRVIVVVWVVWAGLALGLIAVLTPALFRPLERLFAGRKRLGKLFSELHEISVAYSGRKLSVLAGLSISTMSHGLATLSFYFVSLALLPDPPSLMNNMVMVPLVILSTVVPLPFGALGLSEQVSDDLFRLLGHPAGALAMLSFRVVALAVSGVSVAVYFHQSAGAARKSAELST